ncbi:MAG: helix-turn-helix domain-containing protein [Rhodospirillaceae bacterium]|nr:helix-turn-helix domain-containing protein [Rhodospirillaceae bacterium]
MSTIKRSAESLRKYARVNQALITQTGERDIARQAKRDGTSTAKIDLKRGLASGGVRRVAPVDVAAVRAKTGLSQERFARAFRISPHTLRNWEQGRRTPEGPARALLTAIDRDPKALMRALGV